MTEQQRRKITNWTWTLVTRERLSIPFTYNFLRHMQIEVWFDALDIIVRGISEGSHE